MPLRVLGDEMSTVTAVAVLGTSIVIGGDHDDDLTLGGTTLAGEGIFIASLDSNLAPTWVLGGAGVVNDRPNIAFHLSALATAGTDVFATGSHGADEFDLGGSLVDGLGDTLDTGFITRIQGAGGTVEWLESIDPRGSGSYFFTNGRDLTLDGARLVVGGSYQERRIGGAPARGYLAAFDMAGSQGDTLNDQPVVAAIEAYDSGIWFGGRFAGLAFHDGERFEAATETAFVAAADATLSEQLPFDVHDGGNDVCSLVSVDGGYVASVLVRGTVNAFVVGSDGSAEPWLIQTEGATCPVLVEDAGSVYAIQATVTTEGTGTVTFGSLDLGEALDGSLVVVEIDSSVGSVVGGTVAHLGGKLAAINAASPDTGGSSIVIGGVFEGAVPPQVPSSDSFHGAVVRFDLARLSPAG